MQPDYKQLWRNRQQDKISDAQFYAFFEDSLNQFISTNSINGESATSPPAEEAGEAGNCTERGG